MVRKNYSEEQEKMARFAKAMGHPARIKNNSMDYA